MHWGRRATVGTDDPAAGHLDEGVLARLVEDLGPDHVAELCDVFVADARARLAAIGAASDAGDADGAARSAHVLKSSAGFLGAGGLATLCREIEDLARGDRLSEVPPRFDRISAELAQASDELATFVERSLRPR